MDRTTQTNISCFNGFRWLLLMYSAYALSTYNKHKRQIKYSFITSIGPVEHFERKPTISNGKQPMFSLFRIRNNSGTEEFPFIYAYEFGYMWLEIAERCCSILLIRFYRGIVLIPTHNLDIVKL